MDCIEAHFLNALDPIAVIESGIKGAPLKLDIPKLVTVSGISTDPRDLQFDKPNAAIIVIESGI